MKSYTSACKARKQSLRGGKSTRGFPEAARVVNVTAWKPRAGATHTEEAGRSGCGGRRGGVWGWAGLGWVGSGLVSEQGWVSCRGTCVGQKLGWRWGRLEQAGVQGAGVSSLHPEGVFWAAPAPLCSFNAHVSSSVILPLPENVKEYLLDDGTLVWSDDENTTTLKAPEFPEFTAKVQEAISSLGGSVFPKLNWSAPRDAYWIAMNSSLKCKALSDIFLLFKSSDFITRDLTQPFIHCTDDSPDPSLDYELVLRKWCELIPGAEFRCFVKENKLIGISQRDYTQYYDHISKQHEEICRSIQEFFKKHIQYKFLDEDFVFDVYRDSRGRTWLIDFNPFGEVTDSLLFTWEELTSGKNLKGDHDEGETTEQDCPVFRCTNSKVTVQPSPYLSYRLPKDFVDLSTGEDVHKLIDFLKLVRSNENNF
uniref:Translation initiation factor eIF2 assembly protein n=1 Tax=Athene cunicularia TaxID=194338 RepID=A0A663LZI8_ATHCN